MRAYLRGGPTEFATRRLRALELADSEPALEQQLRLLAAVLAYQQARVADPGVRKAADHLVRLARNGAQLNPDEVGEVVTSETELAASALERDIPAGAEPSAADSVYGRAALGSIFELVAARIEMPSAEKWGRPTCPLCGRAAQASVIAEESGELMRGSPRYLLCGMCACSWGFARSVCPGCAEQHPDRLGYYTNGRWPWARVDGCDTCHAYIKTFDLRVPDASSVVPLVDDLGTLPLDLWAQEKGMVPLDRV